MTTADWAQDDDALLARLEHALSVEDMVPNRLVEAAKAAFAWRTVDAELERLTLAADSLLGDRILVRGAVAEAPRILVFQTAGLDLEIEVGAHYITGQVFPIRSGLITVMTAKGTLDETRTDEVGCFVSGRPAPGPFRIRCDTDASNFVTDWITL